MNDDNNGLRGPIKILIIEDNADIQEAIGLIFDLHWPQAHIVQALRGGDGLSLAKSQSPDLVILDLGLPDMDGMKVLKEIRESGNIPLIILTVRGEDLQIKQLSLEEGSFSLEGNVIGLQYTQGGSSRSKAKGKSFLERLLR